MSQDWGVTLKLSAEDARRYLAAYKDRVHPMPVVFGEVAEQIEARLEAAQADQRAFMQRAQLAADEVLPFLERAQERGGWLEGAGRSWSGVQQALLERDVCLQVVVSHSSAADEGVRFLGYRLCPDGDGRSTVGVEEAGERLTAATAPRLLGGKRSGQECRSPACLIESAHEAHA